MAHKGPHTVSSEGAETVREGDWYIVYRIEYCWCGHVISRTRVNRIKGG